MARKIKRQKRKRREDTAPVIEACTSVDEEQAILNAEEKAAADEKAKKLYAAFLRLPFEVQNIILGQLSSTKEFQLTCKAFRNVVLNIPELWTSVSNRENPTYCIKRSRACGLDVDIDFVEYRIPIDRLRLFLLLLEPHYSRVTALAINGSENRTDLWKVVRDQLRNRAFPSLQRLAYEIASAGDGKFNPFASEGPQKDLISSLTLPSLKSLKIKNFFPKEAIKVNTSPTELAVTISHYKESVTGFSTRNRILDSITSMVQSYGRLSELTLNVDNFQLTANYDRDITVDLPTLCTLNIQCSSTRRYLPTAGISASNLTKLLIKCDNMDNTALRSLLEDLFRSDVCRWPLLETLDICLTVSETCNSETKGSLHGREHIIDVALTRLPNVKHLTIESCHYLPPTVMSVLHSERRDTSYPPLQTLSISDSDLKTTFLIPNQEILDSPVFEKLVVTNSSGLLKNVLRSILLPEKKLLYDGVWVRIRSNWGGTHINEHRIRSHRFWFELGAWLSFFGL